MEKILLIDGNSIINRAFYALPLLKNSSGEYTNAVFGFLNIFFRFIDEEKPEYTSVAFDLPKPTFRHKKYPEYKGTRKAMPEELSPQITALKDILKKMNIKIFELEGFEADDVLGTLARKAEEKNIKPVIISGDRDLLQLATDNVMIRIPKTKGSKTEVENYLANDVLEAYGVTPEEFIEVKALMGDSSDNVPGVPGIGEKTAVKLIRQFKSVDGAIANAQEVKSKRASENLVKFKDLALLSKELVTIVTDVPIDFDPEQARIHDMFNNDVMNIFKKNDFKSLLHFFDSSTSGEDEICADFRCIDSLSDAKRFIAELNPWAEIACKIITDEGVILGISFSSDDSTAFIEITNDIDEDSLFEITRDFYEGDTKKIIHDVKTDMVILARKNIMLKNVGFDTFIAAYIINATSTSYNYNDLALEYLDETYESEELILGRRKSKKLLREIEHSVFVKIACLKSNIAFRAAPIIAKKLEEIGQHKLYYDIEYPLIEVLAGMELAGIYVDKTELMQYRIELEKKINELTAEIYAIAGEEFNINSPLQLGNILFEKLKLSNGKRTQKGWSTSADVLERLSNKSPIIDLILEYRTYAKLKSTYADGLLNVRSESTGRIYSTFNQTVTATGRISSSEPNLQNIPIKIELGHRLRKVFKPSRDYIFIDGDYSQIELRVLAHISNDENLIRAFNENQDIHSMTASQVFNVLFDEVSTSQRTKAKAVNFGIIYGKQAFSLSKDLKITNKEAQDYIDGYFEKYPAVKQFMDNVIKTAEECGYTETIFNRRRKIPEINSSNFIKRSQAQRAAMNMPIQGSAADIIKIAMIKVYNRLKRENMKSKLILQVHDELLIEAYKPEAEKAKQILKEEMENAVKLSVPLDIDIHEGVNWYEAK